jgi:hypothetical protein
MNIAKSDIEKAVGLGALKSIRLVSMSVGVIYGHYFDAIYRDMDDRDKREKAIALDSTGRQWRSELRFSLRLQPPNQKADLGGGELIDWAPKKVFLDTSVPVAEVADPASMASLPSSSCGNLNPAGKWLISVLDTMIKPEAKTAVYGSNYADASDHLKIKGIAVQLTVAITH